MSRILCPECGSKISSRAVQCPYCGFQSEDPTRPISEQDTYKKVPTFEYEIEAWEPNRKELSVISYEDNKRLVEFFGSWDNIKLHLPGIAEVISSMAQSQHLMLAKMDEYVKELIDQGVYRFVLDKNGEILPTIRDANGFVKQVRLEEMTLAPNLVQSLNNLSLHAIMIQILDKIEYVGDAIRELHIELQNDRIALAESARDRLRQARLIQDAKLREYSMISAIQGATEAKRTLMRNFIQNMEYIRRNSQKNFVKMMRDKITDRDLSQKALDSLQALVFITNSVQVECEGYALLGEYEPCKECLEEFRRFIMDNKLTQRDTLIMINESSSQNKIEIVDDFVEIADRISNFKTDAHKNDGEIGILLKELNCIKDEEVFDE